MAEDELDEGDGLEMLRTGTLAGAVALLPSRISMCLAATEVLAVAVAPNVVASR